MKTTVLFTTLALSISVISNAAHAAEVWDANGALNIVELAKGGKGGKGGGSTDTPSYTLQSWMHQDIQSAWDAGYFGQNVSVNVIDDFSSSNYLSGNLGIGSQNLTHGGWTSMQAAIVAPQAKITEHDFSNNNAVRLDRRKFNALNLSYGMIADVGYEAVNWSARESSIIDYAHSGRALVVKAAGNDYGTAIGEANSAGKFDYLNRDLIGGQSMIFVGALSSNGSVDQKASIASYSNIAGNNAIVQDQFLVVGVEGYRTGLYGTSFAAPIVTGYAAIISSKFSKADASSIANHLLDTARTDTINGYSEAIHGQGEASLSRALAPIAIN